MKDFHKGVRRFATVIVGFVFFTAGMLKLMDPVGAGLVVKEYFTIFHMDWLSAASKFIGVALALLESLIGAALLAGIWRKQVAIATTALLGFFTLITFYLLVTKSQMDCGCFGEAIHLSTTATFLKNLILCILCVVAFLPAKNYSGTRNSKIAVFAMAIIVIIGFTVYELGHLPLMDFTEFAPGASLVGDGEEEDSKEAESEDEIYLVYEKDGQEGVFTLDRLPDSTWTYVGVKELERKYSDYEDSNPSISIADEEGNYHDDLLNEGNVMVVTVYDAAKLSKEDYASAATFLGLAEAAGFKTAVISREPLDEIQGGYTSDYKKVITLNRSNGGATWISDGEIIAKWPSNHRPDGDELQELITKNDMEYMVKRSSKGRISFQSIMLYTLAILLFA